VFDSLNDADQIKFGLDSVHKAGGVAEATLCYTGDVSDPSRTKVPALPVHAFASWGWPERRSAEGKGHS